MTARNDVKKGGKEENCKNATQQKDRHLGRWLCEGTWESRGLSCRLSQTILLVNALIVLVGDFADSPGGILMRLVARIPGHGLQSSTSQALLAYTLKSKKSSWSQYSKS